MTFECPTLLTSDQAFREDTYTGLYFTPHGAMWGEHVYVIATGFGVDDRIVRYTLTGSGLENPTEIRASTDGGNTRWMTWLTMGADGRCFAHIEDDNWPAPGASRIVEIDLSDGSDRTITSEPQPDSWYYQCLLAHPTGGLFALRHQVASGGAEDFELVGIDPDTSTVTVLASTSAHQIDQTGTRLLPIGTTGSWPGMVGTADGGIWVSIATGTGSGWVHGYRKFAKTGSVLVDNPSPSERTWWWMPDPAAPDTLLASIGTSGPSVGLHRIHSDGTTSSLDCEWAPYPPTIVAPDWSTAIAASWWEAWEEIWLVKGQAPPPSAGSGWRLTGTIGWEATTTPPPAPASIIHWHNEANGPEILTVIDDVDPNPFGLTIIAVGEPTPWAYALTGFASGHIYEVTAESTGASEVKVEGFAGDNPSFDLYFSDGTGTAPPVAVSSEMAVFVYATNSGPSHASGTLTITDLGAAP